MRHSVNQPRKGLAVVGFATTFLFGCATYQGPTEFTSVSVQAPVADVIAMLNTKTARCWSKSPNPLAEGVAAESDRFPDNHAEIRVLRRHWDGRQPSTFMHVHVFPDGSGAKVSYSEGDFNCGFSSCRRLGLSKHLEAWLRGEENCFPFTTF